MNHYKNILNSILDNIDIKISAIEILSEKEQIHIEKNDNLMAQLMECGSSVGGARAKTLIAWNPETNDIRSGQINAGKGYEYWLLKFDNIKNNKDKDSRPDDSEYTKVEYAYYLMALDAGIEIENSLLQGKYLPDSLMLSASGIDSCTITSLPENYVKEPDTHEDMKVKTIESALKTVVSGLFIYDEK